MANPAILSPSPSSFSTHSSQKGHKVNFPTGCDAIGSPPFPVRIIVPHPSPLVLGGVFMLGPPLSIRGPFLVTDSTSLSFKPTSSTGSPALYSLPTLGSHTSGDGSGCAGHLKDTILASTATPRQAIPVCWKPHIWSPPKSSSAEGSGSDSSDSESKDCWAVYGGRLPGTGTGCWQTG